MGRLSLLFTSSGSPPAPCCASLAESVRCAQIIEISGKIMSSKDPLHGITLEALLTALVERYGWAEMARQVNINCFKSDPSVKSSLKFLRRTPWARKEVEEMYIASLDETDVSDAPAESPWANWQAKNKE
jgi:uncharacterized protein (DUF2132 family)